jgi:hypothetical protein
LLGPAFECQDSLAEGDDSRCVRSQACPDRRVSRRSTRAVRRRRPPPAALALVRRTQAAGDYDDRRQRCGHGADRQSSCAFARALQPAIVSHATSPRQRATWPRIHNRVEPEVPWRSPSRSTGVSDCTLECWCRVSMNSLPYGFLSAPRSAKATLGGRCMQVFARRSSFARTR